jgi:thiol-disulfide isomerase/thioredoxin
MLGLFFAFFIGCFAPKGATETGTIETGVDTAEVVSPITWEECSYRIGEHICNLQLTDSNGRDFVLYEHYGRPIIIDLSAEWCSVCKYTADQGEQFMEDWKDQDLLWVTILMENDEGEAPNAADMAEWLNISNGQNSVLLYGSRDLIDPAAENGFPISGWPTFVIINEDLQIYHAFAGWSKEYLEQVLTDMLIIQQ